MPIQKTITETRTVTLMTLQEYADATVIEQYRQPLKTIREALAVNGWDADPFPDNYKPTCCGTEVEVNSFIGSAYRAECAKCGKFIFDVTGPSFGNSWVSVCDSNKVDMETDYDKRWIAGTDVESQKGGGRS